MLAPVHERCEVGVCVVQLNITHYTLHNVVYHISYIMHPGIA